MIRSALANRYLVIVATLVLGSYSYTSIPADLVPMFETSALQIVTFYPGMPPEVMKKGTMSRLQRGSGNRQETKTRKRKRCRGAAL